MEESAGVIVGPQIFDVATHPRGFVLMANNNGVLSYDGVSWRLMPLGRSVLALSLAVSPNGRIFAGGTRTFGEVVEDPTGQLLYQPLESRLRPEDRVFTDVWQTMVSASGVGYFRSPERLIVARESEVRAFTPKGRFSAAALVNGVLFIHDSGLGLLTLGARSLAKAAGGEFFLDMSVTAIAEGGDGSLLVGTQDRGLFTFDIARGQAKALGASVTGLKGSEILSVSRLSDGQIAVGTLRNGLFVLDRLGELRFKMDRDSGLPDNAVLSLRASPGSLWAGTSGGVAQLLLPNPVETFAAREGLPGIVESMVEHKGSIYAATSQGVFRLTCRGQAFEALGALRKQAFALLSTGTLLAATADGIFEIRDNSATLIRAGLARGFAASKKAGRIWAATQAGAVELEGQNNSWTANPIVRGAAPDQDPEDSQNIEATSIGEDADGRVWISLVTGQVISGMPVLAQGALELTDELTFGRGDGIGAGFAEIISLPDGLRIGTTRAVLRVQSGKLVPDASFTDALGPDQGAFRIRSTKDGGYWVASSKRPLRLRRSNPSGAFKVENTAVLRAPAGSRVLDFLEVSDHEVWVATDDGAFRYNPAVPPQVAGGSFAMVRRARSNSNELFSGGPTASLENPLPHLAPLRFEVESSSLDDPSRNRFRFRLDGQDSDWSPWTPESRKDYTNLGSGTYRFRVESRDVYGRVGQEAGFDFAVMTPWYRKPWAVAAGLGATLGLFYAVLSLRTRTLRKRQRELETIVDQKTSELREASFTDPLTGLRNRRYFAEVIDAEVSLAGRPGSSALHLFLVDLDHFKQVNDTHGHAAGDAVLRETAARLKVAMRTSDLIFRWGGEEFLIVARGAKDLPRNEIANRIVRMMSQEPFNIGTDKPLPKTCSVGFATYPFYPDNPTAIPLDAVIELADLSLYRAKQTGRNRAVGVSPQSGAPVPGDVWKDKILENLEKSAVSVEVLEGPSIESS